MIRGTTPTIKFDIILDWSDISILTLTFQQRGENILKFSKDRCTYEDNILSVTLTQEEALSLMDKEKSKIQIKVKLTNGNVLASNVEYMSIDKILDEEVI